MKIRGNIFIKVTAFILCVLSLITAAVTAFGIIGLLAGEFYTKPLDEIRKDLLWGTMNRYASTAANICHNNTGEIDSYTSSKNLYFVISAPDGTVIYSNYAGQDSVFSQDFHAWIDEYIYLSPSDEDIADGATFAVTEAVTLALYEEYMLNEYQKVKVYEYNVKLYLPEEYFTTDMISFLDFWIKTIYEMRVAIYIVCASSLLLFIILLVFLCCVSGWKNDREKPVTCLFDKLPFDIFTAVYVFIIIFAVAFFFDFHFEGFEFVLFIIGAIIAGAVLTVSYIYSLAARAKTGELFRNTLIWWIIKLILRFFGFILRMFGKIIGNLPLYGKTIIILLAMAVWGLILMLFDIDHIPALVLFWIWGGTIASLLAFYITYGLDKLKKGGERISKGDYAHKIDTKYLLPSLKKHANSLNNIGDGMSRALDERLRSERFKTELITNVSHDLKTPLTSIVNYIDLLKTERMADLPDEEKIGEYISVLERQSERLRKLTVDLVEASKASTGNLEVSPAPIELGEMISQTRGEYEEKLSSLGLDLIVRIPSEPITVMADGKHLWRIFDNLMNNIGKYALTGTRVYIDVFEKVGRAFVIFRNTSRYELNISADELTERFVRGDSSRHTEGSGLGLSIAGSLAELNGGKLDIYTDGDLFKVVIGFDIMKKAPEDGEKNDSVK